MKRQIACILITLDAFSILALIVIAVLTATSKISDPLHASYENSIDGSAYDPYLWLALTPLDLFTLVVNFYLAYAARRDRKEDGIRVSKLKVVMLRDNIFYLIP